MLLGLTASATALAAIAAIGSCVCAFASLRLARRIYHEVKGDERIVFGPLQHPNYTVHNNEHSKSVIWCSVFNKAQRKAYINKIEAFSEEGRKINVQWSDSMDKVGMPEEPHGLLGIVDRNTLCIRKTIGGSIDYLRLEVSHSFDKHPQEVISDPVSDWLSKDEIQEDNT
ncbi:MAG: hypothetical protein F4Y03_05355 [Alphaproteobacteria bacterium]|nr:hypothetical protein [Alphaproteobacteria bacterium]